MSALLHCYFSEQPVYGSCLWDMYGKQVHRSACMRCSVRKKLVKHSPHCILQYLRCSTALCKHNCCTQNLRLYNDHGQVKNMSPCREHSLAFLHPLHCPYRKSPSCVRSGIFPSFLPSFLTLSSVYNVHTYQEMGYLTTGYVICQTYIVPSLSWPCVAIAIHDLCCMYIHIVYVTILLA